MGIGGEEQGGFYRPLEVDHTDECFLTALASKLSKHQETSTIMRRSSCSWRTGGGQEQGSQESGAPASGCLTLL